MTLKLKGGNTQALIAESIIIIIIIIIIKNNHNNNHNKCYKSVLSFPINCLLCHQFMMVIRRSKVS